MSARGKTVRVEQHGAEVRLTFELSSVRIATAFTDDLIAQLVKGTLSINLTGVPTSVEEGFPN